MIELWQLYDSQGQPIPGKAAIKEEVFSKGLLHGAAHVWIWRRTGSRVEIMLQKRAADKRTWPGRYDISAAGHVNKDEVLVQTAIREVREEIGISIEQSQLQYIGTHRWRTTTDDGVSIENE